jgi:formylglycine-generating enzyme required for sulfatase activity
MSSTTPHRPHAARAVARLRSALVAGSLLVGTLACTRGTDSASAPAVASVATPSPPSPDAGATGASARSAVECEDEPGMAYIPGGPHRARGEAFRWREVEVKPFWIDRYEVTVDEYRECVGAGACKPPHPSTSGYTDAKLNPLVCTWEIEGVEKLPINCVDGHDQDAFCAWRSKRAPIAYEWSWAAQGREQKRRYPWGDAAPTCELAIIDVDPDDAVRGCGAGRPWPVGSRPSDQSRDGVFDLEGNLSEKTIAPFWDDQPAGYLRDVFGHSWRTKPNPKGVMSNSPSDRDNFSDNSGFRCAKDPGSLPPCTVAE